MKVITNIDRELYGVISEHLAFDRVIITDERIDHIRRRHPGDWENYGRFLADTLISPDFILKDEHPDTAICIKRVEVGAAEKFLRTTLRLQTQHHSNGRENSVLTFQKINQKEYGRLSRNKKVVYRRRQ